MKPSIIMRYIIIKSGLDKTINVINKTVYVIHKTVIVRNKTVK